MRFEDTNLIPELLKAVSDAGYETPTRIQEDTIPLALMGRDVLGCAQTGTGKTAAFALPILQRLYLGEKDLYGGRIAGTKEAPTQFARTMDEAYGRTPKNGEKNRDKSKNGRENRVIRALILTPTRELALQIQESFELYGKHLPLRSCVIFGGVSQNPQVEQLKKGVDILVATPGRLNDLIGQGFISLADLEIFVLDEADRMLDMGFIHDVRRVMTQLPAVRQTLLFSATMPSDVEQLALELLYQPITVKVNPPTSTVDKIHQCVYFIDKVNKKKLLAELVGKPEVESALVFVRTKHGADRVARDLTRAGIKANSIHGDKSQGARQEALSQFKAGKIKALIATDIAARGIDIFGLSHVFNYDVPNEPETYIHRIGRTGRAGLDGEAITFCCYDELEQFRDVEKLIEKNIEEVSSPYPMEVFESSGERIGRPPRSAESSKNSRGGNRNDHQNRSNRSGRSDDVKKYGHDRKEKERRFPKEEWFDPETEDVLERVDGSSFDDAADGAKKPLPENGEAPKKKRRRRRKKKPANPAPEQNALTGGTDAAPTTAQETEPKEESGAPKQNAQRKPKQRNASQKPQGENPSGGETEPAAKSRNEAPKQNRKPKNPKTRDGNASGGEARPEGKALDRTQEKKQDGGKKQQPVKAEPKKERRPYQEHTKIEAQGSVLKHLPKKQETVYETTPDDDFMPEIVFKNNAKNEPKKNIFGNLFHFGKSGESEPAAKPTDELNKDIIETRTWQGSRGQRPKVVDRRSESSDDEL